MYKKFIKRLLDIIFSLILIIVLFPLMLIVGIICRCITGHFIFKQPRDGMHKKSFTMYKISSMKPDFSYSKTLNVIRSYGLDELTQLYNILKGDMSFIGPRPFITGEVLPPDPIDPIIYTVRPGVVSLATAKGRREITHAQRLAYDVEYVKNMSLIMDISIIFKTIIVILKQSIHGDGRV